MTRPDAQVLNQQAREKIYRRNFGWFLIDSILFNVALGIIGSNTVIPDFVRRLTDSEILIGLFGSLFTIGNTLPQLFVARYLVRQERKKWWFIGPNIPVRFVILSFALFTALRGKERPDLIFPAFFMCYSIAAFGDGLVGVTWSELAGSCLDSRWRARMLGLTTACTGVIMLLVAPLIGIVLSDAGPEFPNNYALLFGASGTLFALSILPGLFFHELPGGRAPGKTPSLAEFLPGLGRVLREDGPFRAFIGIRILTSLFMMANPFYIGYATVQLGLSSEVAVPVLLAMQTAGSIVGALVYTWLGARDNLLCIRLALGGATLLPICALLAGVAGPLTLYIGFLISGLVTGNLLSGYLNWVLNYARPEQRPIYVGLASTVAATVSLIAPFIAGTIAQNLGYRPLFVVSLLIALSALVVTIRFLRDARTEEPRQPAVKSTAQHSQ